MEKIGEVSNLLSFSLIFLGVVVIVALFFSVGDPITGDSVAEYNFEDYENIRNQECKWIQVPYEALEEYSETVPYTDVECETKDLRYRVSRGDCVQRKDNLFSSDEPAEYDCTITNLDDEGGTFSMSIGFDIGGQKLEETLSKYIYPSSSETFRVKRDAFIESCFCHENHIPTKEICRDVTKYREVVKTRTITQYRQEEVCN